MTMNFTYSDELYHHGIKGQRWGIRRFQNEDGTLTETGKARQAKLYKEITATYNRRTKKAINYYEKNKDSTNRKKGNKAGKALAKIELENELYKIRKKEIDKGFNYLERRAISKTVVGNLLLGPMGSITALGADYLLNTDQYIERKDVKNIYKFKVGQMK